MVRHTEADDDESTTTTHEATIYHTRFVDEDDDAFELTRDIRMGYEWAVDHDADPADADNFAAAYVEAGTVTVDVPASRSPEAVAYEAWEDGEGHDPGSTRSMATGDIIVVDGDAHFVDSIGFEVVDLPEAVDGDDDGYEPERRAVEYARDLSQDNFDAVVDAVRAEYDADDHDPATSSVLSPVALAVRVCSDALGYDASSCITIDREDEVEVPYDSFEADDPHATPIDVVRLAGQADAATDRTVRFRDGAGSVRVFVEVDDRE